MIIICNKCETKFKVLDNLIPPEGKMVQCSYCNAKWRQDNVAELSTNLGLCVFWIITLCITFSILYLGLIIVYGNTIPIPKFLSDLLISFGIPIEGGNLFGREFDR
ncbi:MAG: hypothetical protein CMJ12_02780 [Pelagibacterales bacterium]|nr:hypothetical protein [Pelagibacterales bacterium]PPR16315.1 MAG: hypothetical protein CFH33_00771 [Alphaproteobacteria bacterium MarineAlpha9_Bin3]